MLIIREAQMQVLRKSSLSDFRRRLSIYVGSFCPDKGRADITGLCDRVLNDCAEYAIERERDIARYARILLRSGAPRPLSKAEQNVLLAHGVSADERLSLLEQLIAKQKGG